MEANGPLDRDQGARGAPVEEVQLQDVRRERAKSLWSQKHESAPTMRKPARRRSPGEPHCESQHRRTNLHALSTAMGDDDGECAASKTSGDPISRWGQGAAVAAKQLRDIGGVPREAVDIGAEGERFWGPHLPLGAVCCQCNLPDMVPEDSDARKACDGPRAECRKTPEAPRRKTTKSNATSGPPCEVAM
eukprot:11500930-Alexandrium_andersonii.AAC.1